jgi:peptidoglycan/LPS O-acetylase OafA/YrhL
VQNLGSGLFCSTCSEEYILPAWSISTEAAAYILFPLLVAGALAGSRWRAAAFAACAAATLVLLSFIPFAWLHTLRRSGPLDISGGETLWSLVRCLAGFSLGLVTWRVAEANAARIARLGGAPDLLILALFAGLWWIHGTDIALVALFPPLILLLCSERSMLGRALGSPLPHRMGDWSYAIYLLHWPALTLMPALLPTIKATHLPHAWSATLALMAAFTLVLAALAHRFVERPARSALRSLMHRRRVPMALEPSAP